MGNLQLISNLHGKRQLSIRNCFESSAKSATGCLQLKESAVGAYNGYWQSGIRCNFKAVTELTICTSVCMIFRHILHYKWLLTIQNFVQTLIRSAV